MQEKLNGKIKKKTQLVVFDIQNTQEEYALCLEFIKLYEAYGMLPQDKVQELSQIISKQRILLRDFDEGASYRWIEEPIQKRGQSVQEALECFNQKKDNSIVLDKEMLRSMITQNQKLHYHLRVHMDFEGKEIKPGNLVHFQYLVLLIQRLSDMGFFKETLKKELTIFLVPGSADSYPFLDEDGLFDAKIYNVVSQYLRMCTKRFNGVIFCANSTKNGVEVHALETHSTRGCDAYFPVISIDANMYEKLFSPNIDLEYFEELQSKQKNKVNGSFGEASNKNPIIAMPDFITKTAYKRILQTFAGQVDDIFNMLRAQSQRSIIQFCLFAFLVNEEEDILDTWKLSGEIEKGIRQVVQNSVQYSQTHECVFSFFLHESKMGESRQHFVRSISKIYPFITIESKPNRKLGALEIFISDLNENQDMIDSFQANLKEDMLSLKIDEDRKESFWGHEAIINDIQKVYIRNMFSEFSDNDLIEEWGQFRKQDIVAHMGLSLFGLTAEKCNAAIKVISCKQSVVSNERNCFYKAYGNEEEQNYSLINSRVIPGTQFSILIPVSHWSQVKTESLGQLVLQNQISEDYRSFAQYLNFSKKNIPIKRQEKAGKTSAASRKLQYSGNIGIRLNKNNNIISWYKFWKKRFIANCEELRKNKVVFNHDFESVSDDPYFRNMDYIEVCLKGLIMALSAIDTDGKTLCIALTNLPEGFIRSFCNIATLIGVRDFPKTVQLYLSESIVSNHSEQYDIILTGKNYAQVMQHAYILSIEHGTNGCSYEEYRKTIELYNKIESNSHMVDEQNANEVVICPFDVILQVSSSANETLFERKVRLMAEDELDGESAGYKLNNTHMRLGSKVHIEAFYEMSFLFYRTSIANRIAFLILRDLQKSKGLDVKKDAIIFYGYASYSKAILTSLTEILRLWRNEKDRRKVGFASYQHNLQSDSNEVQMYFGLESEYFGKVNEKNILELRESVKIVQIVPISSTLTTFSKMWGEFLRHIQKENKTISICGNYTVFWVVDQSSKKPTILPSAIEEKYWTCVSKKKIETVFPTLQLGGCNHVRYFMCSAVAWHDPLNCPLCFPDNVIDEVPLVETDSTSTVPAQQIRFKPNKKKKGQYVQESEENILRLQALKECILLGHIVRRQNHYQYYVDTQRYFYNVKEDVMAWLQGLRGKEIFYQNGSPTLHIIFSPEHNTNVGFAQYVNTYYFGGMAEIVSINVDKEYRSNFLCEHAALKKMIEYLHKYDDKKQNLPVHFYFVDDTIITGETIEKANSFLHSLLPANIKECYHANLFSKIFLLIDRLSDDTKSMYVEQINKNFYSFVHVDVSNIRTQGDSCVGCKLEKITKRMFQRSATRKQSAHWAEKLIAYQKIPFDDLSELEKIDRKHSFDRMMIYHVLQNTIIKNDCAYFMGDAYDVLLDIMEWFLSGGKRGKIYGYKMLFSEIDQFEAIRDILKIICRPFISFDYKIKNQVLTLYVIITEKLLETADNQICKISGILKQKDFLFENDRIDRTIQLSESIKEHLVTPEAELEFLSKYMFEGLTELGSTYLMRKQSMEKIYAYIDEVSRKRLSDNKINEFWDEYALDIHWLLSNTKDESKELWMEYLYSTGEEYDPDKEYFVEGELSDNKELPKLYAEIVKDTSADIVKESFKQFVLELFFQNTGLYFDGIEKMSEINASDEYFMNSWNEMRKLGQWVLDYDYNKIKPVYEKELFAHIKSRQEPEKNKGKIIEWYGTLLELIAKLGEEKYGIQSHDVDIVLMTENSEFEEGDDVIKRLDIINERLDNQSIEKSVTRYLAKYRLKESLESSKTLLDKNGYVLHDSSDEESYFIIFFDNPIVKRGKYSVLNLRSMARVFLYMNVRSENHTSVGIRYIMRDILVYRNRLLRILEQDFYGDTFINYARTNEERNILSHEKAASHSASTDDEISIELFVRRDLKEKNIYANLSDDQKAYWLLIRNYTNNQIAKLFNRTFMDNNDGEIPPLYLSSMLSNDEKQLFGQRILHFYDLKIKGNQPEQDGRFAWIQKIVNLDISIEDDAEFLINDKGLAYNLEYFKCILADILISAIKFQSYQKEDFLLRIDKFMGKDEKKSCTAKIYRLKAEDTHADYLVIENPVNKLGHNLVDWKHRNDLNSMRLKDPLDFVDGHMSLLTIKRYIERLGATKLECRFNYSLLKDDTGKETLAFLTCLPVLKKKEEE